MQATHQGHEFIVLVDVGQEGIDEFREGEEDAVQGVPSLLEDHEGGCYFIQALLVPDILSLHVVSEEYVE